MQRHKIGFLSVSGVAFKSSKTSPTFLVLDSKTKAQDSIIAKFILVLSLIF